MGVVRRLLVLLLVLVSVPFGARAAYACSCVGPVPLEQAVAESAVVLYGEVVEEVDATHYAVQVEGTLKGSLPPRVQLTVWDGDEAGCGTELARGPILLAADADLEVTSCSWQWHGEEARSVLGASGRTLRPPDTRATVPPADSPMAAQPVRYGGPERDTRGQVVLATALGAGALAWGAYLVRRRRTALPAPGRRGDLGTPGAL